MLFARATRFKEVARALRYMLAKEVTVLNFWWEDQAMEVVYKSRHIHIALDLNLETDCWVASADVSWERGGTQLHQLLEGRVGYFKIIDEAEIYAVEMAKTWIDAESGEDLTT